MKLLTPLLAVLALACSQSLAAEVWEPVGLCGGGGMYSLATSPVDPNVMTLSSDMSDAFVSEDGGKTWRMIHHAQLKGCTTCAAAFDPKVRGRAIAPAGWGAGELRVTADCGRTWQPYGQEQPWKRDRATVIYFDPDAPAHVFVGTTAGAWVTDDDGKSWRACQGLAGKALGFAVDRAAPADKRVCFAGTTAGVFRSEDGGKAFAESCQGLPEKQLLSFAGGSKPPLLRLYATIPCKLQDGQLAGGVYVSKDGAKTWERCMNPNLNVETKRSSEWAHGDLPNYVHVRTSDANPERAYTFDAGVSYNPPNHSTIYRTDDSGGRWVATLYSDPRFKEYNVDPDWVSVTIGQKWQDPPNTMIVNNTNPDVVALAHSSYVYRTDNGAQRWRVGHAMPAPDQKKGAPAWLTNGLVVTSTWNYYVDPHEKNRHYICYTDIGFARSLDAGRSWIWGGMKLPWNNTTYELAIDPEVPGRIWGAFSNTHDIPNGNVIEGRHRVIMQGGVALSADFGQTWTKQALPPAPCLSVVLDPTSPRDARTLWASLFEKGVYRSDDGGKTWQEKSKGLGSPENMRPCRIIRHADGTLFVVITAKKMKDGKYTTEGVGLYRSADKGETWTRITESLPLHWPKDFTVHPKDPRTILLGAAQCRFFPEEGGLYRTTDGGKTWTKIVQKGPEHFGAAYHPEKAGWIYMTLAEGAPGAGLWLSKDDGATWEPFDGLPFSNIQRVHFDPGDKEHLYVTTFGGSVFKGPVEPGQ